MCRLRNGVHFVEASMWNGHNKTNTSKLNEYFSGYTVGAIMPQSTARWYLAQQRSDGGKT